MRGGPSPSVVGPCLLGSLGPKALQSGVRMARRGPSTGRRRAVGPALKIHLGRQVGSKFAFFRNLFAFFSHDASKLRFYRFPMVLKWILEGLGKVPGVFWRWFFTRFSKNSIFEKIAFSLEKIDKFKGLSYEKSREKT